MTKKKNFKTALVMAILSLIVCLSMFAGTTFAWFTDSVTSSGNIIASGTLDITMEWADGKADPNSATWTDASAGPIFNNDKWEPGYVEARHIKISNVGTLALKYKVTIAADGEVSKLAKVIDVYYADPAEQVADRASIPAGNKIGTLDAVLAGLDLTGSGKLEANTSDTITLVLKMQENAGNEYQGLSIGSSFSVQVVASQLASEEDSFDDKYDENATYPANISVSKTVSKDADNKTTEDVAITYVDDASAVSKVEVIVPEGTLLEDDAAHLTFKIEQKDEVNAGVATQITSEQSATTYEISLVGVAATNDKPIDVSIFIEKGLIDVKLYHNATLIPSSYDALTGELSFSTTGFSPFTVVSTTKVFESGDGSEENPFIINKAEDLLGISKYYHEYKYYKVADGVETLDLNGIGKINLYGSFDGNGAKFVNLSTALFRGVGNPQDKVKIKIANMDVTVNTTDGNALVRNIYNPGETIFENVAMHGYIEGQYNMGSFYNYGAANHGSSDGANYTVSFKNAKSDVTLVCTTGNVMGGMLGHGYEGADYKLYVNMDEKSGYTGKMYTTTGKDCYQVMAMCSHATYILNGVEVSRYGNTYPSTKLNIAAPTAGEDGYYVAPVDGVDHYVVSLNAQITAYDANGNQIANLSGMTGNLGQTTVTEGFDGKIFDLISSAKIINGTDHNYSYEMNEGDLTVYTGKTSNYASGWITLQVNQYDADGSLLATGNLRVYTIEEVATEAKLVEAVAKGGSFVLTADINIDVAETAFTVAKGKSVTLNLNGHNIIATSTSTEGVQLFSVNGNLEIVGNGTISLTNKDFAWTESYRYTAINIREVGVVTLGEGVKVICEAGSATQKGYGMAYAVDIYTTGKLNVNGASLHSNYIAVRCFYGDSVVNVNSGSITSSKNNYGIWLQSSPNATINIAEGISYTIDTNFDIYIFD